MLKEKKERKKEKMLDLVARCEVRFLIEIGVCKMG